MVKHSRRRCRAGPVVRYLIRPLLRHRARPTRGDARQVLSAFLKLRCEGGKPMEEVFDKSHVERMLRSGQLEDAYYYLQRFLYRVPVKDGSPLSCRLLYQVGLFKTLATVAAGGKDGAALAALYQNTGEYTLKRPIAAPLHKVIAKMNADPIRASKLWQEIQPGQLDRIMNMVSRCPELQGDVRLPHRRILPSDHTTRRLRKYPSRRRKTTNHTPLHVLIHEFLHTRLLMTQGRNGSGVPTNASSRSLALDTQIEQNVPEPIILAEPEQPMEILERAPEK